MANLGSKWMNQPFFSFLQFSCEKRKTNRWTDAQLKKKNITVGVSVVVIVVQVAVYIKTETKRAKGTQS